MRSATAEMVSRAFNPNNPRWVEGLERINSEDMKAFEVAYVGFFAPDEETAERIWNAMVNAVHDEGGLMAIGFNPTPWEEYQT